MNVGTGYMEKGKDSATPDPEGHMTPRKGRKRASERKRAYKKQHRTTQRPGRIERLTRDVQRKNAEVAEASRRALALNRVAIKASAENKQLKK